MKTLQYLPIDIFGSVMGMAALSIAWTVSIHSYVAEVYAFLAVVTFIFGCIVFILKFTKVEYFKTMQVEFMDKAQKPFYSTFCIACLLLPSLLHGIAPKLSYYIWIVGIVTIFIFTTYIALMWFNTRHTFKHLTGGVVVPLVGMLNISAALPFFETPFFNNLSLISIGIGVVFAVPIISILIIRIMYINVSMAHMEAKYNGSLAIIAAPFCVIFIALEPMMEINYISYGLFYSAFFIFVALSPRIIKMLISPFKFALWRTSFPIGLLAICAVKLHHFQPSNIFLTTFSYFLLYLATLVISYYFIMTFYAIVIKRDIRITS
ncbi:hypothetical protein BKH43_02395 [Helicobacter sp. 13S00401-1]|uniref:SLAC1 family transporter n=1 Tax=Helicobacter sp. 13S00401-1 TaxID=1905758 RepID=UPI000BA52A38|nr:hypothetical protein [Helicobacter sp. 13S00401-1]PAF51079.1 hypothetical protein BKH43_02395 [Helicobacter sp. 13S00401-1]